MEFIWIPSDSARLLALLSYTEQTIFLATMTVMNDTHHLQLAVCHLNAPVGPQLSMEQLRTALCAGSSANLNAIATALVRYLFIELEPRLIVQCAYEAGSDVAHANLLYQENLRHAMPRVPAWEQAIEFLL